MFRLIFILLIFFPNVTLSASFYVFSSEELREALVNSSGNGEDDTIILSAGIYTTASGDGGKFRYIDFENHDLSIVGEDAETTILNGEGFDVLDFRNSDHNINVYLESFTIENSNNALESHEYTHLSNMIFRNNSDAILFSMSDKPNAHSIRDSTFINNVGGKLIEGSSVVIENSIFSDNCAMTWLGTGSYYSEINNSVFSFDSEGCSFGDIIRGRLNISDSEFTGISEIRLEGESTSIRRSSFHDLRGAVFINDTLVVNSIFYNNPNSVIWGEGLILNSALINNSSIMASYIINSVMYQNDYDIYVSSTNVPRIVNSFFETINNRQNLPIVFENTISEGNLAFLSMENSDFRLKADSVLIDAGTVSSSYLQTALLEYGFEDIRGFLDLDMDGKQRLAGGSVDIGPYEYSTSRPTINEFRVDGTPKVDQILTFNTVASAIEGRAIVSYDIDVGSGVFINASQSFNFGYGESGIKNVRVRVTDSEDEFSIASQTISIIDLTFEEKLEKARLEVIENPSAYGISFDVDGNGEVDSLTDGLLILRYSFGLTGDALIANVIAEDATRRSAQEIEAYLEKLIP